MQEWSETHLKGRMAETLVSDLLAEAHNQVYQLGYEHILPGLADPKSSLSRSIIGQKIIHIPDFLVLDVQRGEPHLVEVKFRWNPSGYETDDEKFDVYRRYWQEAFIIWVNCSERPFFRYMEHPFDKKFLRPLESFTAFGITKELLEKFDALVEKYLKPTLKLQ